MNGIIVNSCLTCGWQKKDNPLFIKACLSCGNKLKGNQTKYCNKTCNRETHNKMKDKNNYEKMKNEARLKFLTSCSSQKAVALCKKMGLI